jgi:5'-3' exonuclease
MWAECGTVGDVTDAPLLLALDGNSLVHRSYHALASTGMRTRNGAPVWAVRGLLSQLVAAADRIRPSTIVVGFDDPEVSVRRTTWPGYKAHRNDKLKTLVSQLALAATTMRDLGIHVVVPPGFEADDVLASAAEYARRSGLRTVIVTSDRDAFALIDPDTSVLRVINGGVEASPILTPDRLVTLLGVRPDQYRDFAALRGDPSDNLVGVRGVGPKTAAKLLQEFDTAEAVFDDLADGGSAVRAVLGPAIVGRLSDAEARLAWQRNCAVMSLRSDIDLGFDPAGIAGVLPLDAEVVRRTYMGHALPATMPVALRALCHVETEDPNPVLSDNLNWDPTAEWRARRTYPPLAVNQHETNDQLVLF